MPVSSEKLVRTSAMPRMPIWTVRSGSRAPSSAAFRKGPPWWKRLPPEAPSVSQWASMWTSPSGSRLPSALRIG